MDVSPESTSNPGQLGGNANAKTELPTAITVLVNAYLCTLEGVLAEPIFSIRGFFVFYLQCIAWEFGIILMLPIAIINALIRFFGWCFSRTPLIIPNFGLQLSRAAFRSLQRGEISALELVKFRYLSRRLLVWHVRRRLKNCALLLEQEEIFAAFRSGISSQTKPYPEIRTKVLRLEKLLKRTGRFRFVVLLSPLAGVASKFLGVDLPTFLLSKFHPAWQAMFPASQLRPTDAALPEHGMRVQWLAFYLLAEILLGFGIAILSSFIAKRRLLLASNVFQLEGVVFRAWPFLRSREAPLDLIGYGLLLPILFVVYFAAWAIGSSRSPTDEPTFIVMQFMVCASPFIYALYRRIKLGEW